MGHQEHKSIVDSIEAIRRNKRYRLPPEEQAEFDEAFKVITAQVQENYENEINRMKGEMQLKYVDEFTGIPKVNEKGY